MKNSKILVFFLTTTAITTTVLSMQSEEEKSAWELGDLEDVSYGNQIIEEFDVYVNQNGLKKRFKNSGTCSYNEPEKTFKQLVGIIENNLPMNMQSGFNGVLIFLEKIEQGKYLIKTFGNENLQNIDKWLKEHFNKTEHKNVEKEHGNFVEGNIRQTIEEIVEKAVEKGSEVDAQSLLSKIFDIANTKIELRELHQKGALYPLIKECLSKKLMFFQKSRQEHLNAIRKKTDAINKKANKNDDHALDMDYYDNFTCKFFPDPKEDDNYEKKWHQGFREALAKYETPKRDDIMKQMIPNHVDVGVSNFGNITQGSKQGLFGEDKFSIACGSMYLPQTLWTAFFPIDDNYSRNYGKFKLHITALPWSATRVAQVATLVLFGKLTFNELSKQGESSMGQYIEKLWSTHSKTLLDQTKCSYAIHSGKIISTLIEMRGLYATNKECYKYPTNEANYSTQAGKFLVFYSKPDKDSELLRFAKDLDDVFGLLLGMQYFEKGDFLPLKGDAQLGVSGAVYLREERGDREKPLAMMDGFFQEGTLEKMAPLFVGQPIFWMDSLVYGDEKSIAEKLKKFIDDGSKVEVKPVD